MWCPQCGHAFLMDGHRSDCPYYYEPVDGPLWDRASRPPRRHSDLFYSAVPLISGILAITALVAVIAAH